MSGAGALLAQRLGRLRSLGLGDVLREATRLRAALAVPIFRLSYILRVPPAYVWAGFAVMFCATALAVSWVLTALLMMLLNRNKYIAAMERGKVEAQREGDGWSEEEAEGEEQEAGGDGGAHSDVVPTAAPDQLVPASPVSAQQTVKGPTALSARPAAGGGGSGFQPAASAASQAAAAVAPPAAQVKGMGISGTTGILELLRAAETDEEKEMARLARHYATVRPTAVHEVCRLLSGALGVQLGGPAAVAGLLCGPAAVQHAVLGHTTLQARLARHVYGKLYGSGGGSRAAGGDGSVTRGTGGKESGARLASPDAAGEGKGMLGERGRGRDVDAEVVCRVVEEVLQDQVVCRVGRQMRMDVLVGAARELGAAEAAAAAAAAGAAAGNAGGAGGEAVHGEAARGQLGQEGQPGMEAGEVGLSEGEALLSLVWVADGMDGRAGRRAAALLVALACELKLVKGKV